MTADGPRIVAAETALFLDFDGTLVEIAPTPDAVRMACPTRTALLRLQAGLGGALAIVSGRPIEDLDRLTGLALPSAGGHGAERRDADGNTHATGGPEPLDPTLCTPLLRLAEAEGLLVERKAAGVSVHYRARPDLADAVRTVADTLMADAPELRVIHGKMVTELAPARADKGRALDAFMAEPPFAGRTPMAAGDDTTDEDLFAAALAAGGTAIKIGAGSSVAPHRMASTGAFLEWLGAEAARLAPAEEV